MRNPFVRAAMVAALLATTARQAAQQAFALGYLRPNTTGDFRDHVHRTSHRTVAQDKRGAMKARNRKRGK
jgi:hypothetical protein